MAGMTEPHLRPAGPGELPVFWEPARAFLKYSIAFVLAGSAAFLFALVMFAPEQAVRAFSPVSMSLVAATAWLLLARGRVEASVNVLAFGLWAVVSAIAFYTGGVRAMAIIVYPQLILLLGWLVGTRAAVAMGALTVAATFFFALAESRGMLPEEPPTPPAMRWVVLSFVFAYSAFLIAHFVRSYNNRLKQADTLGNELALRSAEVQAREADLNRAQAVAEVGSWVYDMSADLMHLSAETCRIYGVPEGTTGSRDSYFSRVHPDDRLAVDSAWQAAARKGGEPFDCEHRILVGKAIRWVRQRAEPEFGADHKPLRSVGTTQDITERKRHEIEAFAARSQLNATLDAIPDLLFEVGLDGHLFDYHSPRRDLLFAAPEAFLGKKLSEILPPDAADVAMSALRDAHAQGSSQGRQYQLQLPQRTAWFELSIARKLPAPGQEPRFIALSRDISERKQAEEELRKRNIFVETLLENAPIGFAVNTIDDGKVVFVGRNFEKIYGLAPGSVESTADFFEKVYLDPATRESMHGRVMADIASGEPARMRWEDIPLRTQGGLDKFVTASNIPLPEQNLMISTVQDVTERHRAQSALQESEKRYRTLFANSNVVMLLIDPADGGIVDANAAACAFYGRDLPALQALRIEDINTLGAEAVRAEMERAREGSKRHFDFRHRLASGEIRDVEVFSGLVEIDGRELLLSVVQDVTARKIAQQELKKSIAFREQLLEALPLPVFYKDTSGRYAGCNSAFSRFIGMPVAEILGRTVFEVAPRNLARSYRDKDLELFDGTLGVQTYESRIAHADGTLHDAIMHKACMTDDAGRTTGILGVITDITDIRRIEAARDRLKAQLRESQKMEALGTLAGGVAHDFNNVLAAIMGNVELAFLDVGEGHAAVESLEEIRKASLRAKDMVQQILAFSRRQALAREVTWLAPVVEESARLLRATLLEGVSLRVECAPDAPAVLADATRIEQVLLNLCGNAWQAMHGQKRPGLIEVLLEAYVHAPGESRSAPPANLYGEIRPGRYARLTVRDNGPGMDEKTLERIFEPFFTTKPAGKGTGLGLAVVHGVVQEHEGSIQVESVPGEGTSFRIYLPAVDAPVPAVAVQAADGAPAHGQGRRILFVDDDEAIVFLMTRLLERQGYRVSGYTDAREALATVRAQPQAFDIAVTDYNMPGMSGLEVARELHAIRADLPVALASGYITEELRAEAPAAGVAELVYKPNTVDELCDVIARLAKAQPDGD